MNQRLPPHGWQDQPLTNFLDLARENQFGTFHNKRGVVGDICGLDRLLWTCAGEFQGAVNARPANLFFRSHAAFRAGAALAISGQCAEAPSLLCLAPECAGYAAMIRFGDTGLGAIWLRRMESADAKKAVRKAFTPANIRSSIAARDKTLADAFDTLYERLIDFGAHPNEPMLSSHTEMTRLAGEKKLDVIYLQADGPPLDLSLKSMARVGIWSLEVFALMFPERAGELKLRSSLDTIRPRY